MNQIVNTITVFYFFNKHAPIIGHATCGVNNYFTGESTLDMNHYYPLTCHRGAIRRHGRAPPRTSQLQLLLFDGFCLDNVCTLPYHIS